MLENIELGILFIRYVLYETETKLIQSNEST